MRLYDRRIWSENGKYVRPEVMAAMEVRGYQYVMPSVFIREDKKSDDRRVKVDAYWRKKRGAKHFPEITPDDLKKILDDLDGGMEDPIITDERVRVGLYVKNHPELNAGEVAQKVKANMGGFHPISRLFKLAHEAIEARITLKKQANKKKSDKVKRAKERRKKADQGRINRIRIDVGTGASYSKKDMLAIISRAIDEAMKQEDFAYVERYSRKAGMSKDEFLPVSEMYDVRVEAGLVAISHWS